MKILDTSDAISLEPIGKANGLEDAIIVYHLKSPPRLTPEEQAAEDQRILEEGFAHNEYYEEIP